MSFAIVTRPAEDKPAEVVVLFDARQDAEEVAREMRDRGVPVSVETVSDARARTGRRNIVAR